MMQIAADNQELFEQIDSIVANLLRKAAGVGSGHSVVLIVTNAHKSWVEYSSQTVMPQTWSLLKERVRIISARMEPKEGK